MTSYVTVTQDGTIPITDAIRDTLGWRPGDRLTVAMDGYAVTFRLDATPGVMSTGAVGFAPGADPAPAAAPAADADPAPRPASLVDQLIADRLAEIRSGEPA